MLLPLLILVHNHILILFLSSTIDDLSLPYPLDLNVRLYISYVTMRIVTYLSFSYIESEVEIVIQSPRLLFFRSFFLSLSLSIRDI